jgi:hypothetical protein
MEDAEKPDSYLETVEECKDFTFECKARWNDVADSGFMFRKEQRMLLDAPKLHAVYVDVERIKPRRQLPHHSVWLA